MRTQYVRRANSPGYSTAVNDDEYNQLAALNAVLLNAPDDHARRRAQRALGDYGRATGIHERLAEFRNLLKEGIPDPTEAESLKGLVQLATRTAFDPALAQPAGIFREFFDLVRNDDGQLIGIANYVACVNDPGLAEEADAAASCHLTYVVTKPGARSLELNGRIFRNVIKSVYGFAHARQPAITERFPRLLLTAEQNDIRLMNFQMMMQDTVDPFQRALYWQRNRLKIFRMDYIQPSLGPGVAPATNLLLRGGLMTLYPDKLGEPGGYRMIDAQAVNARFVAAHLRKFFACSCVKRPDIGSDPSVVSVEASLNARKDEGGNIGFIAPAEERQMLSEARALYQWIDSAGKHSPALSNHLKRKLLTTPFGHLMDILVPHIDELRQLLSALELVR